MRKIFTTIVMVLLKPTNQGLILLFLLPYLLSASSINPKPSDLLPLMNQQLAIWTFPPYTCGGFPCDFAPTTENVTGTPNLKMYGSSAPNEADPDGNDGVAYTDIAGVVHDISRTIKWDDFKGPPEGFYEISLNTTGWQDIFLRFDYRSEESGSLDISYSLNGGSSFIPIFDNQPIVANETWQAITLDLSAINAIENATSVIIKVHGFNDTNDGNAGDNDDIRFDNIELYGMQSNVCPNAPVITFNDAATTNFLSLTTNGPSYVSGVISDPTDPARIEGINFTLTDPNTPVNSLTVSTSNSNPSVASLNLTGTGGSRNLKITPTGVGFTTIVLTVSDGTCTDTYTIEYAASAATTVPTTSWFHTQTSDASTAIVLDAEYMLVADDENQTIRLYDRNNSGLPLNGFDFSSVLNLNPTTQEVDIEASVQVGSRIYWIGSHGNNESGEDRPNRERIFATDISGAGANTILTFAGFYPYLEDDLIAWDQSNGHGLGANYLGLAASAASGIDPKLTNGFNIEGLVMAPNSATTAYVSFRAPIVPPANRTEALLVPVNNFSSLLGAGTGSASFGAPIFLDLGGRGIRSIEKSGFNEYLIIAGPAGLTGAAPNNFVLYRWDGVADDPALPINNDLSVPVNETGGSFETIIGVPNTSSVGTTINLMLDNGDTQWYGNGVVNKDLGQNNYKKCQQYQISLGATDFCALAIPISCGINYTGNNNTGKYYFNKWASALETTGPELIYKIETTSVGTITVNLQGLSADLDILLLNSCLDNSLIGASQAGGSSNEFISIENAPAGTYYIVIDGYNGATSDFSLNVACTNCSIVTNTNDSGLGSLREAVACTAAGGTIIFDAAINGLPITLTSGEININKNLIFKGSGQNNTIIDGSMDVGNNSRLFSISNNADVEFRDMTFQQGGGVNFNEPGAAMVISNETSVVATVNCKFSNNSTGSIGGAIMIFGGIYKSFNSIYNNNSSSSSGGVFWNQGTGQIDLVQCAIFNNSTSGATNVLVSFSLANIIQCTIAGNNGNRAIENQGTITLQNNIITDNNGIELFSTGITAASNNLLGNPGDLIALIGINGNIQGSADFVNLAAGDLRLLITSDAINKGDQTLIPVDAFDIDNDGNTTEVVSVDLAGDVRVFNSNVEMGAYENDDPCSIILAQAETVSECMDGAYDFFLNVEIANGGSNYVVTPQAGSPIIVPSGLAVIFTDQVGIQNFLIVDGSNPGCSAFAASSPPFGCGTICSEANLTLGSFSLPSNSYSATQTITSSSTIEAESNVEFFAGTSIKLSPGFHAKAGATFSAKIESCTPPSVPAAIATIPSDAIITDRNIALTVQPNPAQYQTTLVFNLSEAASTYLEVYSSTGVRVKTLLNNSWMEAGNYTQDLATDQFQSGIYLVVLRTGNQVITQKLMVLE